MRSIGSTGSKKNILISEDKKNFERIEFHSYGLPWPVWSRDIVFKIKLTRLKSDTFLVTMKSVDDSMGPPTKGVRAELHGSNFILRKSADGKTGSRLISLSTLRERFRRFSSISCSVTGRTTPSWAYVRSKKPFVKTFAGPALVEPADGSLKQVQP